MMVMTAASPLADTERANAYVYSSQDAGAARHTSEEGFSRASARA
jgi:hypothetical protein